MRFLQGLFLVILVCITGCENREAARRQQVANNLKQIGLALKAYEANHSDPEAKQRPEPSDQTTAAAALQTAATERGTDRQANVSDVVAEPHHATDGNVEGIPRKVGKVTCEGTYPHHLQGLCADKEAIYWCFTTTLVKTDLGGKLLKKVPVANHHGDLCFHDGKIYVAVNLGKFNDPQGNADSWIYVYNASDLSLVSKHQTQEVFHGAGGIGVREGRFFVVGGLPEGVEENFVYEYDAEFKFLQKHIIKSGPTLMGIQTATFAKDRWWFGCYGIPQILLVTDAEFKLMGRYEYDCSLGIVGLPDGRFLSAIGRCGKDSCTGSVRLAEADEKTGLRIVENPQAGQQP